MPLYDIKFAEKVTKITDSELLTFYIEAVINKIERILGYKLKKATYNHKLYGVDKEYAYTIARPLTQILQINKDNYDITNQCNIESERKIGLNFELCKCEYIQAKYEAGYDTLPEYIQYFIFSQVKNLVNTVNNAGIKSYSIETISYTFEDTVNRNDDFIKEVRNIFGVI